MLQNEASAFVLQIYFYAAPIAAMAACTLVCGCRPSEQFFAFFPESESLLDRQDNSSCISISERSEAARRHIGICLNVFKEVEFPHPWQPSSPQLFAGRVQMFFDPRQRLRTGRQALFCRNILCIAIFRSISCQKTDYLSPEKKQVVTAGRREGRPQEIWSWFEKQQQSKGEVPVRTFESSEKFAASNLAQQLHTLHVQNSRFGACLRVVHKAEAAITCHHTQLGAMLKGVAGAIRTVSCLGTLCILCLVCLATRMSMWIFQEKYELRGSYIQTYRFRIRMCHLLTSWISCVCPPVAISKFLSQRRDGGWEPGTVASRLFGGSVQFTAPGQTTREWFLAKRFALLLDAGLATVCSG